MSLLLCALLCSLSLAVYLQISPTYTSTNTFPVVNTSDIGVDDSVSTLSKMDLSEAGLFALYVEVLLLIYTVIPLPLYGTLIVGLSYTLLFEVIAGTRLASRCVSSTNASVGSGFVPFSFIYKPCTLAANMGSCHHYKPVTMVIRSLIKPNRAHFLGALKTHS